MNIAEILKYCPKGTKLYSTIFGEVIFERVSSDETYPIKVKNWNNETCVFTEEGKYLSPYKGECILSPSKEQRDWSKFRIPVKRGDIMMGISGKSSFIASGKIVNNNPNGICGIAYGGSFIINNNNNNCWTDEFCISATEEVKTKLFAAIEKAGYRWNTETLELERIKQVNEVIADFESARKALGLETDDGFRAASWLTGEDALSISKVSHFVHEINPKHAEALIALNKLFTLAEAWNKEDGFVPDFSDCNQDKWFPWFKYDNDAARFVYANTADAPTNASAGLGSRLCFKSSARAEQFGTQFADLYNKIFL